MLETFGHYDLMEELGHGATCTVYRARHRVLEREVALKVFKVQEVDAEWRQRLFREVRAVAKLEHPNIVRVYEVCEIDGVPCVAFELLRGGTLRTILERGGALSPAAALALVEKIALGLHYAHEQGIVHRDLKPANILLDASGEPRIADFGIAKDMKDDRAHLTESGTLVGTPEYVSPEQALGSVRELDRRVDVWALGVVLYELVSNSNPFRDDNVFRVLDLVKKLDVAPPLDPSGGSTGRAGEIALAAMRRNRDERTPTALAFAQACRSALEAASPPPPAPTRPRPIFFVLLLLLAGALAVLVGLSTLEHGGPGIDISLVNSGTGSRSPSPTPSSTMPPLVAPSDRPRPTPSAPPDPSPVTSGAVVLGDDRGRLPQDVRCIAVSPSGGHLAVGCLGGDVFLFEALTGKALACRTRLGHVSALAYSADGSLIAIGRDDGSVEVADSVTLAPLPLNSEPKPQPPPPGKPLLTAKPLVVLVPEVGPGRSTIAWTGTNTKAVLRITSPAGVTTEPAAGASGEHSLALNVGVYKAQLFANHLAVTPLATVEVRGVPQSALPADARPPCRVTCVAFSSDAGSIAAAFETGPPLLWNLTDREPLALAIGPGLTVHALAISPDRRYVAGGTSTGALLLWSLATGALAGRVDLEVGPIASLALGPHGDLLAAGVKGSALFDWSHPHPSKTLWTHKDAGAVVGLGGARVVLDARGEIASLLEPETGQPARAPIPLAVKPVAVALSPDGKRFWVASLTTVACWDATAGTRLWPGPGDDACIVGIGETADHRIFAARREGTLELYDGSSSERTTFASVGHKLHSAAVDPTGSMAFVTCVGKTISAWDLTTWTESAHADLPADALDVVSPAGGRALLRDQRGALSVWSAGSKPIPLTEETNQATSHGGLVTGVGCARDQSVSAWCTHDAVFLRVEMPGEKWQLLPDVLPLRPARVAVTLSSDGRFVLLGRMGGELDLFDRTTSKWRRIATTTRGSHIPTIALATEIGLAICGLPGEQHVRIYNLTTGDELEPVKLPFDFPSRVLVSSNNTLLIGTKRGIVITVPASTLGH